jgi:hypothetical protein
VKSYFESVSSMRFDFDNVFSDMAANAGNLRHTGNRTQLWTDVSILDGAQTGKIETLRFSGMTGAEGGAGSLGVGLRKRHDLLFVLFRQDSFAFSFFPPRLPVHIHLVILVTIDPGRVDAELAWGMP